MSNTLLKNKKITQEALNGVGSLIQPYQFYSNIVDNAFSGTLTLPTGLKYIGTNGFAAARSGLTSLVCNSDLKTIGDYAFANYTQSEFSVTFNNQLEFIGNYAFDGSKISGQLNIPDSVIVIRDYAFRNHSKITSVRWPTNCNVINQYTFSTNNSSNMLRSITNTDNIHFIGQQALSNSKFTNLFLPNIENIGTMAFSNCSALTTITFGANLGAITTSTFSSCTSLTTINVMGDENCLTAQKLATLTPAQYNNATIVYNYTPPTD